MTATVSTEAEPPPEMGRVRRIVTDLARGAFDLSIADKIYGIILMLVIVTVFLVIMSFQSVRLQTEYRQRQANSATAAINLERVNGLIYAVVMESRGIYMSADRGAAKQFSDGLIKRNRELAGVVAEWEQTVRFDDAEQFSAFKQRITQFIEFRYELVRRGIQVSTASAREWGDNDANRSLRSRLNADLEALAKIYRGRGREINALSEMGRYASWYQLALGSVTMLLAALGVFVIRKFMIGPLAEITLATDWVTKGKFNSAIPHTTRKDEIGHLARAVQHFREAVGRNYELEQLGRSNATHLDAVMEEQTKLTDKYNATKWQLSAAITSMPQGVIMLDQNTEILALNDQYRKMYGLPPAFKAGSSLEQILQHRADNGIFTGNVKKYLAEIVVRIAKRQPSSHEVTLGDGRVVKIVERAMDGGGWIAVHEDITQLRISQRILERTEQFLAAVMENVPVAILAKDARSLRYVLVNRAAELMIGKSRSEMMGKTARELFSAETADLIERRDRQQMSQEQKLEVVVDTIDNPIKGRRIIAARRLQIGGPDHESHLLVSMIEDRTNQTTDQANVAGVAA